MNTCPKKLTVLRKHFGYSQQAVADSCHVTLQEYMGWENGRAIPNMEQFGLLAKLYGLRLDDLFKDTLHIAIPKKPSVEDSVEIPFVQSELEETPIVIARNSAPEPTPLSDTQPVKRVSGVEEPQTGSREEYRPQRPTERPSAKPAQTKKRLTQQAKILIGVGVAVLGFLLIFGIVSLMKPKTDSNELNLPISKERLAAGETASFILKDDGSVEARGGRVETTNLNGLAEIEAKGQWVVGLKKTGKPVVASGNAVVKEEVEKWEQVTDIEIGETHIVGLNKDGTVSCAGAGSTGCAVDEWKDIQEIYVGDGVTVGIDKSNKVWVSGDCPYQEDIEERIQDIAELIFHEDIVVMIYNDQTVAIFGTDEYSVQDFTNIKQIVIGDNYLAGLKTTGRVVISTEDKVLQETVNGWSDIDEIAGEGEYIVALDKSNKLKGAGDNSHNQFDSEPVAEEPGKLETVTELSFSETATTVRFSWNPVTGADFYEVNINIGGGYSVKVQETKISINLSRFESGVEYTVSVIAKANSAQKEASDAATIQYTYTAPEPTEEPTPSPDPTLIPSTPTPTPNCGTNGEFNGTNCTCKIGWSGEFCNIQDPTPTPTPTSEPTATPTPTPTDDAGTATDNPNGSGQ